MNIDAYIALGSNQGNREFNLLRAIAETGKLPDSKITALSSFYKTSPVGNVQQPFFYNAVLCLSTVLAPQELLEKLQYIESVIFKRQRTIHNGPRNMDLDLLLYGDRIIQLENLTVPHAHMTERRFVLQPLCEIAPDLIHPVLGVSISSVFETLRSDETVVKV